MRAPLSGIVSGFRIRQSGTAKDMSEYGYIDLLQPGDKNYDSSLTHIVVQDTDLITFMLQHYSSGQLRWINMLCHQIPNGRELIWLLKKIYTFAPDSLTVHDAPLALEVESNDG